MPDNNVNVIINGDASGLQNASQQAASAVNRLNNEVDKAEKTTQKQGLSAMQTTRLNMRMGDTFMGVAGQMTGLGGAGGMLLGTMDKLGDTIEMVTVRGGSAKDVFSAIKGELGMIASAGVIGAVAMGFKYLTDQAKANVATIEKALAIYDQISADRAKAQLDKLNTAFKDGKISIEEYSQKYEKFAAQIATASINKDIAATEDKIKSLNGTLETANALQKWGERLSALGIGTTLMAIGAGMEYVKQQELDAQNVILIAQKQKKNEAIRLAKKERDEKIAAMQEEYAKRQEIFMAEMGLLEYENTKKIEATRATYAFVNATYATSTKNKIQYEVQGLDATNKISLLEMVVAANKNKYDVAWARYSEQEKLRIKTAFANAGISLINNTLGAIAAGMNAGTNAYRNIMRGQIIMDTIHGAWGAYTQAMATYAPPFGAIIGAAAAAAVAAGGAAQLVKLNSSGGASAPTVNMPSIPEPSVAGGTGQTPRTGAGTEGTSHTGSGRNMASTNTIANVNFTQSVIVNGNIMVKDFMDMLKEYTEIGIRAGGGRMATV